MTFLMSMITILYLKSELCSGRNKNLMVGMRRHKNVTEKHFLPSAKKQAGVRGEQDYQEGGTMSGEDDTNAGRTSTMDVQRYRCSNCIIGTENNPFICTQCGLANSDADGQFVCRRCRKGPARGRGQLSTFNCRRCTNSNPDNCEVTRVQ